MKFRDLKDIHKGQISFLCGAGPSLHSTDMTLLKDHISIAVNSGVVKAKECDYFVSDDIAIKNWSYYTDLLPTLDCIKLLYKDKLEGNCSNLSNVVLFEHTWWYSPATKTYNMDGLKLNKTGPIIGARTSMGSAVHLAYIMGCNPIVLLGNDCCLKDGKRYFWQYDGEEKTHRVRGRSFSSKTQNLGFDRGAFEEYWNTFFEVNKDILGKEVDIIDGSDSALSCFPKMTVEKIIEKYKGF